MLSILISMLASTIFGLFFPQKVWAEGEILGIHILNPYELQDAQDLLKADDNQDGWNYVTIPLSLEDLDQTQEWQDFFDQAREARIQPIIRLVTKFEDGAWQVPDRRQLVSYFSFLNKLNWPRETMPVIILNEPNQVAEFGGQVSPEGYAEVLAFAAAWAQTEQRQFIVLPAGLDLAAPNGRNTMDAFNYLDRMLAYNPRVFDDLDAWNSHSYANPGFSSSPERTDQRSLRGFEHELSYLKEKTGRDFEVYITETGWLDNRQTSQWLDEYYLYAYQHIWSDSRIKAVTPFLLRGAPGPFAGFSFLDEDNQPTRQYQAFRQLLTKEM